MQNMNLNPSQHQSSHAEDFVVFKCATQKIFTWPPKKIDNALATLFTAMIEHIRKRNQVWVSTGAQRKTGTDDNPSL